MIDRDLTPEGERILENILAYDRLKRGITETVEPPVPPVIKKGKYQLENEALRMELIKMIYNSRMVIVDCDTILSQLTTAEEYINNDAKVVKTIHQNLIDRLMRVLRGESALKDESHLDMEAIKRMYPLLTR